MTKQAAHARSLGRRQVARGRATRRCHRGAARPRPTLLVDDRVGRPANIPCLLGAARFASWNAHFAPALANAPACRVARLPAERVACLPACALARLPRCLTVQLAACWPACALARTIAPSRARRPTCVAVCLVACGLERLPSRLPVCPPDCPVAGAPAFLLACCLLACLPACPLARLRACLPATVPLCRLAFLRASLSAFSAGAVQSRLAGPFLAQTLGRARQRHGVPAAPCARHCSRGHSAPAEGATGDSLEARGAWRPSAHPSKEPASRPANSPTGLPVDQPSYELTTRPNSQPRRQQTGHPAPPARSHAMIESPMRRSDPEEASNDPDARPHAARVRRMSPLRGRLLQVSDARVWNFALCGRPRVEQVCWTSEECVSMGVAGKPPLLGASQP